MKLWWILIMNCGFLVQLSIHVNIWYLLDPIRLHFLKQHLASNFIVVHIIIFKNYGIHRHKHLILLTIIEQVFFCLFTISNKHVYFWHWLQFSSLAFKPMCCTSPYVDMAQTRLISHPLFHWSLRDKLERNYIQYVCNSF